MPFYQHSETRERVECSLEEFDYLKAGGTISVAKEGSRECELWGFPNKSQLPVLVRRGTTTNEPPAEEDEVVESAIVSPEEPSASQHPPSDPDSLDDWDGVDFSQNH